MLIILTTHPIQYQIPVWQRLAGGSSVPFAVWYMSDHGVSPSFDPEFRQAFRWDLDMLHGYPSEFIGMRPSVDDLSELRHSLIASFSSRLRDNHVQAVWIQGWQVPAYWQATFSASRIGIPVWLRGESNNLPQRTGAKQLVRTQALRLLFGRISRFLYIGAANRDMYTAMGVPDSKLVSAPYCVDNNRFASTSDSFRADRDGIRARWNIPAEAICLLFSGKLIPKKRPLDLLAAAERVLIAGDEHARRLHVLVAGDGELIGPVRAAAARLHAIAGQPMVTIAGFLNQTEIPQAYAAADWVVLPSDARETWGLVINEALASGTPAIASNLCGCARDLVQPLDPRLVYPCGNVEALSRLLSDVAAGRISPPCATRCREVVDRFDVMWTTAAVTREYRSLLEGRDRRQGVL